MAQTALIERSRPRPRLTTNVLLVLGAMNLIDCINVNLLTPYVDKMVSSFMSEPTDASDVVRTVGILIGLYSLCEVLFSPLWGYLSDKVGRRPVLLIGLAGSAVAPIIFGLARALPMAFFGRGLDGFFCGNNGVTKTYLGELVDETNEARGFSFLATCFSIGLVLGPMIGGMLADPMSWAPSMFQGTVFDRFPYLLPNLSYACLAVLAWLVGVFFLEETFTSETRERHRQSREVPKALSETLLPTTVRNTGLQSGAVSTRSHRRDLVFLSFGLMFLSGYFSAWTSNMVLIIALPRSVGGFALQPEEIGTVMNFGGLGLLLSQLFLYPFLAKRFGLLGVFKIGCVLNVTVTLLLPVYGLMADPDVFGSWRLVPLAFMCLIGYTGGGFCFPTGYVWLNRKLSDEERGSVNGVVNSMGALARGVFPPVASTLLSVGLSTGTPGGRYFAVWANSLALGVSYWLMKNGSQSGAKSTDHTSDNTLSKGDFDQTLGECVSAVGMPCDDNQSTTSSSGRSSRGEF